MYSARLFPIFLVLPRKKTRVNEEDNRAVVSRRDDGGSCSEALPTAPAPLHDPGLEDDGAARSPAAKQIWAAREDVVTNSPSHGRGKSQSKPGQRRCALLAESLAICSVLANRQRRARLLMSLRVAIERHEAPMPMPSCTSHRSRAARCRGLCLEQIEQWN
jgi:hypothetical protein